MNFPPKAFSLLQKIGKAMMLPVSVLPVAGILLGVGSANFTWLPPILSLIMAQAGGAIFGFLPLLFAIAIAVGLTENDGVAALASTVGYLVLVATMGVATAFFALWHGTPPVIPDVTLAPDLIGQIRQILGAAITQGKLVVGNAELTSIMGMGSIETGVFGGILVGLVAGWAFNRFYRIQLPSYLGFFAGKRAVPIITAFAAIILGVLLSIIWPPVGAVIKRFSDWAATGQPVIAFTLYGFVERLLIPLGLHHVWNVPFFFEVGQYTDPAGHVVRGEINRFIAGDPMAGHMAGGYLFKMWGLPAAAVAMWRSARPENRTKVGGIMISAALTAFLTGITEPIEFAFLFLAPALYFIHALLAGAAYGTCILLGIKHGMTFSHGLIDFVVLFPKSHHAAWLFVLGPIWATIYYGVFRFAIVKFDLKTPGREVEIAFSCIPTRSTGTENIALEIVRGLGGRSNIASLDACITRLRVKLYDPSRVNAPKLKALGAAGVLTAGDSVQAIFGTRAENYKTDIQQYLKTAGPEADQLDEPAPGEVAPGAVVSKLNDADSVRRVANVIAALGGRGNIRQVDACAETRLRIVVADAAKVDEGRMRAAGIAGLIKLPERVVHLLAGARADQYAAALREQLAALPHERPNT